jgi:hypothetical protein
MAGAGETVIRRRRGVRAGAFRGDEIRRNAGRRLALPLIAASLIALGEIAILKPQPKPDKQPATAPEPTINAPAFVRPPGPTPDVLIGRRVRIG